MSGAGAAGNRHDRSPVLPVKADVVRFIDSLLGVLFPHFCEVTYFQEAEIEGQLKLLQRHLRQVLVPLEGNLAHPEEIVSRISAAFVPVEIDDVEKLMAEEGFAEKNRATKAKY